MDKLTFIVDNGEDVDSSVEVVFHVAIGMTVDDMFELWKHGMSALGYFMEKYELWREYEPEVKEARRPSDDSDADL